MKTKARFRHKIITLLLAVCVLMAMSSSLAFADTDTKYDTSCQGDATQCLCPKSDAAKNPNCGQDIVFKDCERIGKTEQYQTDCIKNNNIFTKYVNPIIRALTIMVPIACAIGIIIGGYVYVTSAGDAQKVVAGKHFIRNAIISLLVYFVLFAALKFLIPGTNVFSS